MCTAEGSSRIDRTFVTSSEEAPSIDCEIASTNSIPKAAIRFFQRSLAAPFIKENVAQKRDVAQRRLTSSTASAIDRKTIGLSQMCASSSTTDAAHHVASPAANVSDGPAVT